MAKDEELENVKEQILRRLMEKPNRGPWKDGAEPLYGVKPLDERAAIQLERALESWRGS